MREPQLTIRPAAAEDLQGIVTLLKSVKLPTDGVELHWQNFLVLVDEQKIVGCVGLEIYGSKALLRSLAVARDLHRRGLGSRLYNSVTERAQKMNLEDIYLLTETAEPFFAARGFQIISRDLVDAVVKTSVEFRSACPQSAVCMRLKLD